METGLSYKKLDVYRCSVEFLAVAVGVVDKVPRGFASLADQMRRAALSVPLNIAEGSGKGSRADRQRYLEIARGSALECSAVLDACRVVGVGEELALERGEELLVRIVSMLTRMCR